MRSQAGRVGHELRNDENASHRLIRVIGATFDAPIESVLDFFTRYRLPLLILSVILVGFTVWNERRLGKGELGTIRELEDELAPEDEETE